MKKKIGAFGAGQFSLGTLVEGQPGTTIFQNPGGGVGLGWVGSRPRLVAYPRSAAPSLPDPTGRPYPGVRSQGLPDC